jgi:hypothetical protein
MGRYLAIGLPILAVSGCSSKYRVASYEKPVTELSRQEGFYVTLPADGSYDGQVYERSGTYAAQAVTNALLAHAQKVETGIVPGEDLSSALKIVHEPIDRQPRGIGDDEVDQDPNPKERATEIQGSEQAHGDRRHGNQDQHRHSARHEKTDQEASRKGQDVIHPNELKNNSTPTGAPSLEP